MSRFKRMLAVITMSISMVVPVSMVAAPAALAAEAGQSCSFGGKWGGKTYTSGNIVFRKWFYSHGVCWTVHDQFGRSSNYTVATHRPQAGTTNVRQFTGIYTVGDTHDLAQWIDIEVWKGDGSWIKVRLNG